MRVVLHALARVGKRRGKKKKERKKIEERSGKWKGEGKERKEGEETRRDSCNEGVKIVVTSSLTLYHVASPKMQPR